MFVCCECCVLSGRGLFDELITRPEEFYRLWCVVVCDLKTSRMRKPWPALGLSATKQNQSESYVIRKFCGFLSLSMSHGLNIFLCLFFFHTSEALDNVAKITFRCKCKLLPSD